MEHIIKVFLCCLVVVFFVIVCRFGHDVRHISIIEVKQFSERKAQLLAPEEVQCSIEFTIERPLQFFGLLWVFAPDCQISMISPVIPASSSWSIVRSQ